MKDPFAEPADTREEILEAAFHALCRHGYADLTIQRIGETFEKSPTLVYHHYDGKDELLVDLLAFLLDGFEESVSTGSFDLPPRERIVAYVLAMSDPGGVDHADAPDARFLRAVVELRAQAANDEAYRDHFDRSDRVFDRFLERSVREAAAEVRSAEDVRTDDEGVPADDGPDAAGTIAPAEVVAVIGTLAVGGTFRRVTTNDREWVDGVTAGVGRYLDVTLPNVALE